MARYTGAVCRLCRREATKLFLKGAKCASDRCPLEKRNFPPGMHGKDRKAKIVGYGLQLHEKQKAKRMWTTSPSGWALPSLAARLARSFATATSKSTDTRSTFLLTK